MLVEAAVVAIVVAILSRARGTTAPPAGTPPSTEPAAAPPTGGVRGDYDHTKEDKDLGLAIGLGAAGLAGAVAGPVLAYVLTKAPEVAVGVGGGVGGGVATGGSTGGAVATTAGATLTPAVLGPATVAAIAGVSIAVVWVAIWVAIIFAAAQNTTTYGWQDTTLPEGDRWRGLGLPYRPDHCYWGAELASMYIPAPPGLLAEGGVELGRHDAARFDLPVWALETLMPGRGALAACLRSGMFSWRPGDITTPVTRLLAAVAPHLAEYEAGLQLDNPGDILSGDPFFWWHLDALGDDPGSGLWFIRAGRRLAAFRELGLPREHWVRLTVDDLTAPRNDGSYPPYFHECSSVGTWLLNNRYYPWPVGGTTQTLDHANRINGLLTSLGIPAYVCDPHVNLTCALVRLGHDGSRHKSPGRAGFPGAWCLAPPDSRPTLPAVDVVHRWRHLKPEYQAQVGAMAANPASAPVANIWRGGHGAYELYDERVVIIRSAPQYQAPPGDSCFFVWLADGEHIVPLSYFADLFGGLAGARAALESGGLAWDPSRDIPSTWVTDYDTARRVAERWREIAPATLAAEARFTGWEGFTNVV